MGLGYVELQYDYCIENIGDSILATLGANIPCPKGPFKYLYGSL